MIEIFLILAILVAISIPLWLSILWTLFISLPSWVHINSLVFFIALTLLAIRNPSKTMGSWHPIRFMLLMVHAMPFIVLLREVTGNPLIHYVLPGIISYLLMGVEYMLLRRYYPESWLGRSLLWSGKEE